MGTTHFTSDLQTFTVDISVGTEASNVIPVTIQLKDNYGMNKAESRVLQWYLATDAAGNTPAGSAPSGGVAATTGNIIEWANNLSGLVVLDSTGKAVLSITEALTPTYYLVVVVEGGRKVVSDPIKFS